MITFKQYLSEEEKFVSLDTILRDDCGEFLHATGGEYLVRGMKIPRGERHYAQDPHSENGVIEYQLITPRTDRTPLDTSPRVHRFLDKWFNDHFGFRARTQAVFAFGQKTDQSNITANYGTPYMIFPVGPFDYVWSPTVQDLYTEMLQKWGDDWESELDLFLTEKHYQKKGIDKAAKSKNEIMIKCDKYIAISIEFKPVIRKYFNSL